MTWLEAQPIRVIHRSESGAGTIEIPIMATASGSAVELTVEMMEQLVANFELFPVVPVSVSPHREFAERGGFSEAFVESIELRGDLLFGRLSLGAELFAEVVEQGGWRGFSVEIAKNLKTQAKSIEGWVLTGGVFTNRPAVDAHFRIAAEARPGSDASGVYEASFKSLEKGKESSMSDKPTAPAPGAEHQLAALREGAKALEAEKIALQTRVTHLSDEVRVLKSENEQHQTDLQAAKDVAATGGAKITRLETEARGMKDANATLRKGVEDLTEKLSVSNNENLSAKVLAIRDRAVAAGVPPAIFDGVDKDPAGWMLASYTNVEAFETTITALAGVSRDLVTDPPKSGKGSSKGSGEQTNLSADDKKRLARIGVRNLDLVGIKTEAELLDMRAEQKDKE